MLGSLKILSGHDGFLIEQFGTVIRFLCELDFGCGSAARVLSISQCLEVVRLSLINVRRFKLGQFLSFRNPASLSCVKPDQPSLIDWANDGDAVLRYQDLS